jgi:hypothetical protein
MNGCDTFSPSAERCLLSAVKILEMAILFDFSHLEIVFSFCLNIHVTDRRMLSNIRNYRDNLHLCRLTFKL